MAVRSFYAMLVRSLDRLIFRRGRLLSEMKGIADTGFIATNLDALQELAARYQDQSRDLADVCLVLMSELYPSM